MIELSRRYLVFPALLLVMFVAGCALTPRGKAPLPLQQAQKRNQRGVTADEQKRYAVAEAEFREAYRLYSSIENYEGMMTVLINFSRLYRHQKDAVRAGIMANRAVELVREVPHLSAEVWFEQAKIAMLIKSFENAITFSGKALDAANDKELPRMLVLAATAHAMGGKAGMANELGNDALKASRKHGDRFEESNAHRILAELAMARKSAAEANAFYLEALAIDKELALPARIADDLRGLSVSSAGVGDRNLAAGYLVRAAEVCLADNDKSGASSDLAKAVAICGQPTEGGCTPEITGKLQLYQSLGAAR